MRTTTEIIGEAVLHRLTRDALVSVMALVDDFRSLGAAPEDIRHEMEREILANIQAEVADGMRGDLDG